MKLFHPLLIDLIGLREDAWGWRGAQPTLDIHAVENVCLLSPANRLGDSIVLSLIVDALSTSRPSLPIIVCTAGAFEAYWASHPAVSEVIVLPKSRSIFRSLSKVATQWRIGRRFRDRFDVLISVSGFNRPDHFALVRGMGARTTVGFNKLQYRLFDYSIDERTHGGECQPVHFKTASIMRLFGIEVSVKGLAAHLPFSPEDERAAERIVDRLRSPGPRLLLNAYGKSGTRVLSPASVVRLIEEIRRAGFVGPVFVSVPGERVEEYESALSQQQCRSPLEVVGPQEDLGVLFAFVAAMDVVVSTDTAVGHIAAALSKPQIALFSRAGNLPVVWRPLNDRCVSVVSRVHEDVNGVDWEEFRAAFTAVSRLESNARPTPRRG